MSESVGKGLAIGCGQESADQEGRLRGRGIKVRIGFGLLAEAVVEQLSQNHADKLAADQDLLDEHLALA